MPQFGDPCMEMGQAAGLAVNICMENGDISVCDIERAELVAGVRAEGSFV